MHTHTHNKKTKKKRKEKTERKMGVGVGETMKTGELNHKLITLHKGCLQNINRKKNAVYLATASRP